MRKGTILRVMMVSRLKAIFILLDGSTNLEDYGLPFIEPYPSIYPDLYSHINLLDDINII
jgi:hypothetical protein